MIRYTLVCSEGHEFDGWFRSSADFERQAAGGLLGCAVCGSEKVSKALMAPSVRTRSASPEVAGQETQVSAEVAGGAALPAGPTAPAAMMAMGSPEMRALVEAVRAIKRKVVETAEDVGARFPEEARRIHYGETPARGIYGAASLDDARALVEEGIEIMALPSLPEDRN